MSTQRIWVQSIMSFRNRLSSILNAVYPIPIVWSWHSYSGDKIETFPDRCTVPLCNDEFPCARMPICVHDTAPNTNGVNAYVQNYIVQSTWSTIVHAKERNDTIQAPLVQRMYDLVSRMNWIANPILRKVFSHHDA